MRKRGIYQRKKSYFSIAPAGLAATMLLVFSSNVVLAQSAFQPPDFPRMSEAVDEFGVNLKKGSMVIPYPALTSAGISRVGSFNLVFPFPSYGTGPTSGITEQYRGYFPNKDNNYNEILVSLTSAENNYWALFPSYEGGSEEYQYKNWKFYPKSGAVNFLDCDVDPNPSKECRYTLKDGTVVYYSRDNTLYRSSAADKFFWGQFNYRNLAYKAVKPDGEELIYSYWKIPLGTINGVAAYNYLLKSVTTSLGWAVMYDYSFDNYSATAVPESMKLADPDAGTVYIINTALDNCSDAGTATTEQYPDTYTMVMKTRYVLTTGCSSFKKQQTLTYRQYPLGSEAGALKKVIIGFGPAAAPLLTVTGTYMITGAGVRRDYEALQSFQNWNEPDRKFISKVTMGNYVKTYVVWEDTDSTYFYAKATDVNGKEVQMQTANRSQNLYEYKDENGRSTIYGYNDDDLLTGVYPPGDNDTWIEYNSRRNITRIIKDPRPDGSIPGNAKIIQVYEYETENCDTTNKFVCDKVKKYTDPRGAVTDFTYYPEHGGVKTETGPAVNNVRPQVRYEYAQLTPRLNRWPQLPLPTKPVYKLVKESRCVTATAADPASCVGTDKEIITTYSYDVDHNVLLASKTVKAGGGTAQETTGLTTTFAYDYYGNVTTIDGPLPGTDDAVYMTYDDHNRLIMEKGPDPDGSGPLTRIITTHGYDPDGRDTGTATYADGSAVGSSIPIIYKKMYYDTTGRLIRTETGNQ